MVRRKSITVASSAFIRQQAEQIIGEPLIGEYGRRIKDPDLMTRQVAQMSILYHDHGWPMEQIGYAFGRSRERIRQVFEQYNLPVRAPNGAAVYIQDKNRNKALQNLRKAVESAAY